MHGPPDGVCDTVGRRLIPHLGSCCCFPSHFLSPVMELRAQHSGWRRREILGSILPSQGSWKLAHALTFPQEKSWTENSSLGTELCCLTGMLMQVMSNHPPYPLQCIQYRIFSLQWCAGTSLPDSRSSTKVLWSMGDHHLLYYCFKLHLIVSLFLTLKIFYIYFPNQIISNMRWHFIYTIVQFHPLRFFFFYFFIEVQLIYNVVLVSGVQQSDPVLYMYAYVYIYIFFRFFSIVGYYKILKIVLCTIEQVLVVYLFYIWQCVSANLNH